MSCLDDLKDFYAFYAFYDFYGFNDFNDFNDLPLTAYRLLLTTRCGIADLGLRICNVVRS
ncbi:MAG: hypothetical protein V3W19_00175 [Desulfatiglandales bacterium]